MRLIFHGPPGVGKGTQAGKIGLEENISHISSGDLLRAAVDAKTEIGLKAREYIENGLLVPDELIVNIVANKINSAECEKGFILDGFPRFMEQYESAKTFLEPTAVLIIDVPKEESLKRILKRAEIENRTDDTPESIERRLAWSREKTVPVIAQYTTLGLTHTVNGVGEIDEVEGRINQVLGIS